MPRKVPAVKSANRGAYTSGWQMRAYLREQPTAVTEYDEKHVRRLVEMVTFYEDRFVVEFKSGVMVDVEKDQSVEQGESK